MITIKALADDVSKIGTIMTKVYAIGVNDFEVAEEEDGSANIVINDSKKRYDSKVLIELEENGVMAYLSIYPAIGGGSTLIFDDIMEVITEGGITINVNRNVIEQAALKNQDNTIVDHVLFATGHHPQMGRDAMITIQFSTVEKKAKIEKSGKIDYKNVDNIIHAAKGDVLITKRPATAGVRGLTVKNTEIVPPEGKDIEILCGEGVMENAVGTAYVATHEGYVEFNNNVLAVHQVFFVHGDVDYATGNIRFNGTIHVKGDVLSGFRIEASKDIIVDGICGDSEVIAHKSLFLKTGIKGSQKNLFRAGEDAYIGYCEKATVFAKRNIIIKKYAYNSDLSAGNRIDATQTDGIIAGGHIKAFAEIQAKQVGTEGNSKFTLEVGTKYYVDQAVNRLRKEKTRMMETLGQINSALCKVDLDIEEVSEHHTVQKLLDIKRNFELTITDMQKREDELNAEARCKRPKIKVRGRIYEGVTVMIYNCASTIRQFMENAVFYLDEKYAEVAWISLKDMKEIELADGEPEGFKVN